MTRFLGIDLSEGVKRRHLLAYLFTAFISSSYAGALSMLQPGLLQVMGVDRAAQATLTGNLSALQEIILILCFGPIGAIADRYGRKPVYVFGLLMTALGFVLYPRAESIAMLVVYRVVVAFGTAAMVGLFGVAGAIGILVGTAGGGWLFATYGPSTPFVLFGLLNGVVFL